MRTTIELSDEVRARLLALAAKRGQKGFSSIVQEALERYLDAENDDERVERARNAIGALNDRDADELRASIADLRDRWR